MDLGRWWCVSVSSSTVINTPQRDGMLTVGKEEVMGLGLLSAQVCCESKTVLKNKWC